MMKNFKLQLGLMSVALCLSVAAPAKSLTDILIDGIAEKISETIAPKVEAKIEANKTATPVTQPIQQATVNTESNIWTKETECDDNGICAINEISPSRNMLITSICRDSEHCDIVALSKSSASRTVIWDNLPQDLLGRVSVSWLDNMVAKFYLGAGSYTGGAAYFNSVSNQVTHYEHPLTEVMNPYGNGYYLANMDFKKDKAVLAVYEIFPCQKTDKPFSYISLPNASPVAHAGLIQEAELYFQNVGNEEDENPQLRLRAKYTAGANYDKTRSIDVAIKTPDHNCGF